MVLTVYTELQDEPQLEGLDASPSKTPQSCRSRKSMDSQAGTSELTPSIVNLFKSIVGAGMLSLSNGVASFSDESVGLVSGLCILSVFGACSAYSFWSLGRLCLETRSRNYVELMGRACGPSWRLAAEVFIAVKCGFGVLVFEIILGDTARDLGALCGLRGLLAERSTLLVALAALCLLPLSLLRSFAALAPIAAMGSLGVLYTIAFMVFRWMQGSYEEGGIFDGQVPRTPDFNVYGTHGAGAFLLISMLAPAFLCHWNAPKFMWQMAQPSAERFAVVSCTGFLVATLANGACMAMGFLTFGGAAQGLVLNNYAVTDRLAFLARAATLVSLVSSFPFVLVGFRDGILRLLLRPAEAGDSWKPSRSAQVLAVLLTVPCATIVAIVETDLGFVVSCGGAIFAIAIIYVFPAKAYIGVFQDSIENGTATPEERREYTMNVALMMLGVLVAVVGGLSTFAKKFGILHV